MSNNIYNILGKLKGITDTASPNGTTPTEPVYESVEPRGSITEAVKGLEEKYMGFKKTVAAVKKGGSAEDPEAVAAAIGRKKYGKEKFQKAAAKDKKLGEAAKPDFLDVDGDGDKKEPFKKAVKDKKAVKESAEAQKGAQAILQALSPEEEQEFASIVKQAGNNPQRIFQALGITAQDLQNPQVAEGIAPDLKGKIIQALWTAGAIGAVAAGVGGHEIISANLAAPLLMAAGAVWADVPGQVGHNPQANKVQESGGPYELYNPKHPKFAANYAKFKAKNPGCKLEDFIAAMKKKEHNVAEAAYDEPAAPDAAAIERRKRLQALKDKREEEGHGDDAVNNPIRKVAGKAYGGAAQKDAPEVDDLAEKAPPGAKAERMVKHIKKGYAKDGKLTKKEKGIAYATAWKAHNKGQVEEGVKFGDTIKNSKAEMKKAKPAMVKESRVMEETDYFYEKIGRAIAEMNPTLDTASSEFRTATLKAMVAHGIEPNRARNIMMLDDDFLSDVADSYHHCCQEIAECGAPMNSFLGGAKELDEIARLAGLPTKEAVYTETTDDERKLERYHELIRQGMDPDDAEVMVFNDEDDSDDLDEAVPVPRKVMDPNKAPSAPGKFAQPATPAGQSIPSAPVRVGEEEMEEGNEFSGALAAAKASGAKEFEVDGKKYTVKEDVNVNISAQGEEDVTNLIRKLAGIPTVAMVQNPESEVRDVEAVEVDEERDIEYANTPNEKIGPVSAAIPSGTDLNRSKKQYRKEYPGDNPMAVAEATESLWEKYSTMLKGLIK